MRPLIVTFILLFSSFVFAQAETTQTMLPASGQHDLRFRMDFSDYSISNFGYLRTAFNYDYFYGFTGGHFLNIGFDHGTIEHDEIFIPGPNTTVKPPTSSGPGEFRAGYIYRTEGVGQGGSALFGLSYHHPLEDPEISPDGTPYNFAPRQPYFGLLAAIVLPAQGAFKWGSAVDLELNLENDEKTPTGTEKISGNHKTKISIFGELESSFRPNVEVNYLHWSKEVEEFQGNKSEGVDRKFFKLKASLRPNISESFQIIPSLARQWYLKDNNSDPDIDIWNISVGIRVLL